MSPASAERHLDRARVYRLLGRLFQPPRPEVVAAIRDEDLPALADCLEALGADGDLLAVAGAVVEALGATPETDLARQWAATFEPEGSLGVSPTETAHSLGSGPAAWLKGYRIADVAGFYRAFGVEVEPGTERPDHLGAELEFMHLLALKEAIALDEGDSEAAEVCAEARAAFLHDHLGGWTDALAGKVEQAPGAVYSPAASLLAAFVRFDSGA